MVFQVFCDVQRANKTCHIAFSSCTVINSFAVLLWQPCKQQSLLIERESPKHAGVRGQLLRPVRAGTAEPGHHLACPHSLDRGVQPGVCRAQRGK